MRQAFNDFLYGLIPGHPVWSYLLALVIILIVGSGVGYLLRLLFITILKLVATTIAILFDKERRDQFLGFTDNDKEDKK